MSLELTISSHRKVSLGNYESEDVFTSVSGITSETTEEEVSALLSHGESLYELLRVETLRKVQAIKNPKPTDEPKAGKDYGPAPAAQPKNSEDGCFFRKKAKRIADDAGFTIEQCLEFEAICRNRGIDHVAMIIDAQEESCTSYEQYAVYAATGQKPDTAKLRLAK